MHNANARAHALRRQLVDSGYAVAPVSPSISQLAVTVGRILPRALDDLTATSRLAGLADAWAPDPSVREAIKWRRRGRDDAKGCKAYVQTAAGFGRYLRTVPNVPRFTRGFFYGLDLFAAEGQRVLAAVGGPDSSFRYTVRAILYQPHGFAIPHFDDSAFTVIFTDAAGELRVGRGDGTPAADAALHPVRRDETAAVVLAGQHVGAVLPGALPSPHAALPAHSSTRLSVTVFAHWCRGTTS